MSEPVVVTATPAAKPPPAPVVEAPPAAPAPDLKLKAEYEKMAAREKTTLAERQKVAEDRRAIEAERASIAKEKEEIARLRSERDGAKKDPETYLKSLYGDQWFSHLSELALDKKPPASLEVAALRDELDALRTETKADRAKREAADKAREEQQQQQAVDDFNAGITDAVKKAGDKYKLINKLGYHDQVQELIRQHWEKQKKDGTPAEEMKVLNTDEAAQMVEDHWIAQAKEAATLLGLTKPAEPVIPPKTTLEGKSREGTLTNDLTGSSAKPATASRLSADEAEKERTKRAFAAFDAAKKRP